MKFVKITNGSYRNNNFEGVFELGSKGVCQLNAPNPANNKTHKIFVIVDGKERGVFVNATDWQKCGTPSVPTVPTDDELREEIAKRFDIMDLMGDGVSTGSIRSMMIAGAAGIGKTYSLEQKLNAQKDAGKINFKLIKGKISAIGLYCTLWDYQAEDCVVVLDDVDVFSDLDTLNILKGALDTGEKRTITWATASSYLDDKGIDNEFEFKGSIIFITNMNVDRVLNSNNKNAPHLNALVSRSIYLDLKVHTNREIMWRVEDVVGKTDMLQKKGLDNGDIVSVLEYMNKNVNKFRSVSLRTALQIADFMNTNKDRWEDFADVCLLK